jgi:hypothetical protein
MHEHPVRLVVEDDLARNRWTVFFRVLLAIPHFVWIILWTIATVFVVIANWLVALVRGRPASGLHRFTCSYIRYVTHLSAYLWLVANPYPPFDGRAGEYPIDLQLPEPATQRRWTTFFRIFLALPALVVSGALIGPSGASLTSGRGSRTASYFGGGLTGVASFLGWFAIMGTKQMPKGLRDAAAYGIGYQAQALAYLLLVTDRYPDADPTALLETVARPPEHPVRLVGDPHDLRRSRVTVFFRPLLAIPHLVWLILWGIAVVCSSIVNWFVTLFGGTPAASLHRFASRWLRYRLHVYAYLFLAANPFPGFVGETGSYPLDLELPAATRQNRWKTAFRLPLVIPAAIVSGALTGVLVAAAVLTWFHALVTGSATWGLRNLSAYAIRYDAQTNAYVFLVTGAYPHASPLEGE